ncbi:hypothetical protein L345_01139, partial [Ophiophagus hannah]
MPALPTASAPSSAPESETFDPENPRTGGQLVEQRESLPGWSSSPEGLQPSHQQDAVLRSGPAVPDTGKLLDHLLLLERGSCAQTRTFGRSFVNIRLELQTWAFPSHLVLQRVSGAQLKLFNLMDQPYLFPSLSLFLKDGRRKGPRPGLDSASRELDWLLFTFQKAFQDSKVDVQVAVTKNEPLKSFRKAVLIVIASETMRKSPASLFSDEDLLDILSTILEPVTFDICSSTEATSSIYHFWRNIIYNIQDTDHKSLVCKEPAQLVAMHLQGLNMEQAVKLKMSVYRPKIEAGTQKVPVEATIQGNLDKSQLGRFLFYKIENGKHTRFESAECPGWFICTSSQNDEAVAVTKQPGGPRVIVDYSLTS